MEFFHTLYETTGKLFQFGINRLTPLGLSSVLLFRVLTIDNFVVISVCLLGHNKLNNDNSSCTRRYFHCHFSMLTGAQQIK